MDYFSNTRLAQERIQNFINEADEVRNARRLGTVRKRNWLMQIRTFIIKTFTLTIR